MKRGIINNVASTPTSPSNGITNHEQRPNVLLAVTGSVAAVKGPEIAVELVKRFNSNVRVLLTRGGSNFWEKANGYDSKHWAEMMSFINQQPTNKGSNPKLEPPRICVIGKSFPL